MALINSCSNNPDFQILATKTLSHYPSASSIEWYNDKLFIMGDDAQYLIVLDKYYNTTDSIQLFTNTEKRIPKAIKADPEASTIIELQNTKHLLLVGSGSTENREKAFTINLTTNHTDTFSLSNFYTKIKAKDIDINIEGVASVHDKIAFANRANLTSKTNQLIIADSNFLLNENADFKIISVNDTAKTIRGISSLTYLKEKDILILTATEEETINSYSDGTIGNSYIGFITGFYKKINSENITVDKWINLPELNSVFSKQKIEGLTIESLQNNKLILHLVSDNDNGESSLYKVQLSL